jgi:vacuolar-type H+-ATPase subunit H
MDYDKSTKPLKAIEGVRDAEAGAQLILENARKRKEKAISDANAKAERIIDEASRDANALSEKMLAAAEKELAALRKRKLEVAKNSAAKIRKARLGRQRLEKLAAQVAKEIVGA